MLHANSFSPLRTYLGGAALCACVRACVRVCLRQFRWMCTRKTRHTLRHGHGHAVAILLRTAVVHFTYEPKQTGDISVGSQSILPVSPFLYPKTAGCIISTDGIGGLYSAGASTSSGLRGKKKGEGEGESERGRERGREGERIVVSWLLSIRVVVCTWLETKEALLLQAVKKRGSLCSQCVQIQNRIRWKKKKRSDGGGGRQRDHR